MNEELSTLNVEPAFPTHPGAILKDEIEYSGFSQREIAKKMGVPASRLNEILNAKRPLSTEYALMLEAVLGVDAQTLLAMQARYDMLQAKRDKSFMARLQQMRRVAAVL